MLGVERWELVERMDALGCGRPSRYSMKSRQTGRADSPRARGGAPKGDHDAASDPMLGQRSRHKNEGLVPTRGTELLRRKDYPDGKSTLAFVG